MKTQKHLSFDQRKVIAFRISHNFKVKDIAEALGFDPTSISKEANRNKIKNGNKSSVCNNSPPNRI